MSAQPEWGREIPSGWSYRRLRTLGRFSKGFGGSKEDNRDAGVPVVRYGDLYTTFDTVITKPVAYVDHATADTYATLRPGVLVMTASGEDRAEIGKAALSMLTGHVVVGGDAILFQPGRETDGLYLAYALQSAPAVAQKTGLSTGFTVVHITAGRLKTVSLPLPPVTEQRAIADYLDRETAKIDTLIEKQTTMIERLRERRVGVIAHATTRGIRSGVKLKDAPQWQGQVPAHWVESPIRRALQFRRQLVGATWSTTQLLSLTKQGVIVRDIESGEGKFPASFEGYQHVKPNDLIFCLFDIDETPRTVGRASDYGMVTGAYTRYCVRENVANPHFLEWAFIAIDDGKRFRPLYTGLRKVIQKPRFVGARLALPPLDEQREIADYLDRETAKIDSLITKVERHIELAKERRAALITAAVTGQIDVTNPTQSGDAA